MNLSNTLILGMVAGSLLVSLPAQAYDGLPAGAFVIAKRDSNDDFRDSRDSREIRDEPRSERSKAGTSRNAQRRNDGDTKGYGYGYERRQREPESRDTGEDRRESRDERRSNSNRR